MYLKVANDVDIKADTDRPIYRPTTNDPPGVREANSGVKVIPVRNATRNPAKKERTKLPANIKILLFNAAS